MKSQSGTEIILIVGVMIAIGIALVQLRGIFYSQQILSQEEVVVTFSNNLEAVVDKAISATGDTTFSYIPQIKKYSVDINSNLVSIYDKTSNKNASFFKSNPQIIDNYFEDCSKIFVIKKENKIVITCKCHENGETCKDSLICCSGYCNETSQKCDIPPICPEQQKCPGAPMAGIAGGNAWIDINGKVCCPFNNIDDVSGPVCSSSHCCPTHKPLWCGRPKTGNPRCVDKNEYDTEGCEEICPPDISQCIDHWHWNHYGGTFEMNVNGNLCDYYEVCHPNIKPIIEEIIHCCDNKCTGNCHSMCNRALSDSGLSSIDTTETRKKCYGLYAIYGLDGAAKWMKGYQIHIEEPASIMLTSQTWMCTGYSMSLTTLLRSVGYQSDEAYSVATLDHAFNLVKFPGETEYRWVDTVENILYISGITSSDPYRVNYGECRSVSLNMFGCQNDAGVYNCPSTSNIFMGASC